VRGMSNLETLYLLALTVTPIFLIDGSRHSKDDRDRIE
jgi:hypothetical protein